MLKSKRLGKFISPFVLMAMLVSGIAGIAKAQPKQQSKKQSKFEFGIRPSITFPFKSPAEDYYKELNKDFRTGKYTFTTPIADADGKSLWKDIKTPSSIGFGVEGSLLYRLKFGKIKNLRVGVAVGYEGSSSRSTYNESYDIWDKYYKGGSYVPLNFKRREGISISTISLGAIKKASLTDKLDVSSTAGVKFYEAKGDVNCTMDRLDNPYVQWRKASYSGSGTGPFIELGVNYNISNNVSIGGGFGYRGGKVKTKGKDVKTEYGLPGMSWIYDYSPEIPFNITYGKVGVEVKF